MPARKPSPPASVLAAAPDIAAQQCRSGPVPCESVEKLRARERKRVQPVELLRGSRESGFARSPVSAPVANDASSLRVAWRPLRLRPLTRCGGLRGRGGMGRGLRRRGRMRGRLAEARDAACSLALVDHALRGSLRDRADGGGQLGLRSRRVAARQRLAKLAHLRAQRRRDRLIARAMPDCLAVLLLCRPGVRHVFRRSADSKRCGRIAPVPSTVNREGSAPRRPSTPCPPAQKTTNPECLEQILLHQC